MKYTSLASLVCSFGFLFLSRPAAAQDGTPEVVAIDQTKIFTVTDKIRFNEGSLALKNEMLLTNFGSSELNPLGKEGKGYVISLNKEGIQMLIAPDGTLDAPKGMAVVKDDYLFIADVGKVVVYNLKKMKSGERPVVIPMPDGQDYVNDVVALDDLLLVSVTNSGHLYSIDVKDCEALRSVRPRLAATIPGANGLAEREGTLYIASYAPDNDPKAENVIYAVDLTNPGSQPVNMLGERKGLYDGLAVSADGSKLYFSNWRNAEGKAEIGYIDLTADKNYAVTILDLGLELKGPADISLSSDGYLYVPDLPANKLYIVELK